MNNFTTELLLIQDKNIKVDGELKKETIKGQKYFIFEGKLSYKPKKCPCCRQKDSEKIVKDGFSRVCKIPMLKISEIPSYLNLRKQRFKCKVCNKKFTASTSLVQKHCNISQNIKRAIIKDLTQILSFKQIAKINNVSSSTVIRILKSCKELVEINHYKDLPEHLCFDEIKSTKDSANGMSFVFLDAITHNFIDIIDGRTKRILNEYFLKFSRKAKLKVKTICIDIYPPYMDIIKQHFPNADIIIDRFHIVQNINRELNKARIKLMNSYKGASTYTLLKNYWKLVLADADKVDDSKYFFNRSLNKLVTQKQILNEILSLDKEFSNSYNVVQDIRSSIKDKDINKLSQLIDIDTKEFCSRIKKAIKTMKKHKPYMLNSVKYSYSNAPLEGFNNKIKLLKRVSYGYNSFIHFRLRILIVSRLFVFNHKNNNLDMKIKKPTKLLVSA